MVIFIQHIFVQVLLSDTVGAGDAYKSNAGTTPVHCKASEATSSGTGSFEWICDGRIAANQVEIISASATADLAEVVIVGFEWGEYNRPQWSYRINNIDNGYVM